MLVEELMIEDVITANENATVAETERVMSVHNIGRLIIVDNLGEVVGVITNSDLVKQRDFDLEVKEIMSTDLIKVYKSQTIQEVAQVLSDNQIAGVPVFDKNEKLAGVITSDDIVSGYVKEERTAKLTPESSAIYLAMTRSRDYEEYWLDKIKGYGYKPAITQTGANAENLPIKLRESATVAAIARGVVKERLKDKLAISSAVKDAYTQLNLINPGLGGGFKVAIVRGEGRVAVAIFGKFGHALVDGPEQIATGVSVI
ncbi:HutP family protein [Selenihalanaerobacter shriftii]|uniref:Hut operon positive regulatory protein n=1 Tax=Selenihalanaerobacter shriftii TaxID=142842 RepID=A0A1T4QCP7_9FIRM|nr:HutP family protein [Selenihalanaerobacter shriftii]SKA01522.1 acetoin utilization protein AcuB [Selenihalanaerobacter shriftii]